MFRLSNRLQFRPSSSTRARVRVLLMSQLYDSKHMKMQSTDFPFARHQSKQQAKQVDIISEFMRRSLSI